jgi:acylphosphatase
MVRRRVFVSGRVQGVWFRASCRDVAVSLGLSGWVRNLPDGRVEALFEGEPAAVEAAVSWCATGPRGALVTSVDKIEEAPQGETGFRVR